MRGLHHKTDCKSSGSLTEQIQIQWIFTSHMAQYHLGTEMVSVTSPLQLWRKLLRPRSQLSHTIYVLDESRCWCGSWMSCVSGCRTLWSNRAVQLRPCLKEAACGGGQWHNRHFDWYQSTTVGSGINKDFRFANHEWMYSVGLMSCMRVKVDGLNVPIWVPGILFCYVAVLSRLQVSQRSKGALWKTR